MVQGSAELGSGDHIFCAMRQRTIFSKFVHVHATKHPISGRASDDQRIGPYSLKVHFGFKEAVPRQSRTIEADLKIKLLVN